MTADATIPAAARPPRRDDAARRSAGQRRPVDHLRASSTTRAVLLAAPPRRRRRDEGRPRRPAHAQRDPLGRDARWPSCASARCCAAEHVVATAGARRATRSGGGDPPRARPDVSAIVHTSTTSRRSARASVTSRRGRRHPTAPVTASGVARRRPPARRRRRRRSSTRWKRSCVPLTTWSSSSRREAVARPRASIHTHGNALRATARRASRRGASRAGERLYIPMPFFWMGGFGGGLLTVLVAGATLLTESDPEPARTLAFLERERVTLFRGWPDQAARIAADPSFATRRRVVAASRQPRRGASRRSATRTRCAREPLRHDGVVRPVLR